MDNNVNNDDLLIMDFLFNDNDNINNVIRVVAENADPVEERLQHNHNEQPIRNLNYFEETIPHYSLSEFKSHFRMSHEAVEHLSGLLIPLLPGERHSITPLKQILFSIWILSKPENFLSAADRFGISSGNGHFIFMKVISAMKHLKDRLIQWPNQNECNEIATRIENQCGFPGIIGGIDGTHVIIKEPAHNPVDFFNRKDSHSVILQAVCNDQLVFTDVFIGMPGRMHDARVFRTSPLCQKLTDDPPLIHPHQHISGDAAYPLMVNLLKPYRDNGHLTEIQSRFNITLSSQRSVIERAFALLKGKWRRLKFLDMSLQERIPEVVLATCILHNFILQQNDNNEYSDEIFEKNHNGNNEIEILAEDDPPNRRNEIKRDYIASILRPIR